MLAWRNLLGHVLSASRRLMKYKQASGCQEENCIGNKGMKREETEQVDLQNRSFSFCRSRQRGNSQRNKRQTAQWAVHALLRRTFDMMDISGNIPGSTVARGRWTGFLVNWIDKVKTNRKRIGHEEIGELKITIDPAVTIPARQLGRIKKRKKEKKKNPEIKQKEKWRNDMKTRSPLRRKKSFGTRT